MSKAAQLVYAYVAAHPNVTGPQLIEGVGPTLESAGMSIKSASSYLSQMKAAGIVEARIHNGRMFYSTVKPFDMDAIRELAVQRNREIKAQKLQEKINKGTIPSRVHAYLTQNPLSTSSELALGLPDLKAASVAAAVAMLINTKQAEVVRNYGFPVKYRAHGVYNAKQVSELRAASKTKWKKGGNSTKQHSAKAAKESQGALNWTTQRPIAATNHKVAVRPNLTLELPADLTQAEADRLSAMIKLLPLRA